ncbi:MAG: hypothetical protein AB1306_09575 [Nitrospirota bacterium]
MMNKKTILVTVILIVIFSFVFASLWANGKLKNKKGLTHMASSPQGTIFLTIEDYLLRVSPEGRLLSKMHLNDDLGIDGRITDICVLNDGRFLIGLGNSHQIKAYSPDGSVINSYNVEHSDYDFSITSNTSNDLFYIALSNRQRGQIHVFDSSWQKVSSISNFINPDIPKPAVDDDGYEDEMTADIPQDHNDYFDPADIAYHDNRLYIADYRNRIVILNTDGTFDKIIASPEREISQYIYTVRLARSGNMLYIVTYDDNHDRGAITAVDINRDERIHIADITIEDSGRLYFKGHLHYPDIVARESDILLIDQSAVSVQRLSHDGKYIGLFGDASVQSAIREIERPYTISKILRFGSIGGAIFALIVLVLVYRTTKKSPTPENNLFSIPISASHILGQEGHRRRKILLIAVPGLGQLAVGKKLRAILFALPCAVLLFFLFSFIYASVKHFYFIYYVIYTATFLILIWAASARDALSLNEGGLKPWEFRLKGVLTRILIPLIPVMVGAIAQVLWEINSRRDPTLSLTLQNILKDIILYLSMADNGFMTFAVILPANTIIAWSLALCAIFVCIAWEIGDRGIDLITKGIVGFLSGIVSSIILTIILTRYSGGSLFYSPLLTGILIGVSLLVTFKKRIPPLVVVSSIAGTGLANAVKIYAIAALLRTMLLGPFDPSFLLGTSARINHVVTDIYFLHFSTLLVLSATNSRKAEIDTG